MYLCEVRFSKMAIAAQLLIGNHNKTRDARISKL